jgi:AraC-like DNA-binding protein
LVADHDNMNKPDIKYQPNLAFREFNIPAGEEWLPRLTGWSLIFVRQGSGYCLQTQSKRELDAGSLLLLAGPLAGGIRASQLGELSLCSFNVIPDRLTSLISLDEQHHYRLPPESESVFKILPPDSPIAISMSRLVVEKKRARLLFRLKLLQIFAELFVQDQPQPELAGIKADDSDALKRLQGFLEEIPASELMDMDFNHLAAMTHCTARHLSRVFQKLVGMSFSEKRAELRMARAEELLATSNSKVVQVALDSGYNSLSQFNLMFIRRYGISPGKWREKFGYGNHQSNGKPNGKNAHQRSGPVAKMTSASREAPLLKVPGKWNTNGHFRSNSQTQ